MHACSRARCLYPHPRPMRACVRMYLMRQRNALTRQFVRRARFRAFKGVRAGSGDRSPRAIISYIPRGCVGSAPLKVLDTLRFDITRSCPHTSTAIPFTWRGIYVPAAPVHFHFGIPARAGGRHTHYSYLNEKRGPRLFAGISLV